MLTERNGFVVVAFRGTEPTPEHRTLIFGPPLFWDSTCGPFRANGLKVFEVEEEAVTAARDQKRRLNLDGGGFDTRAVLIKLRIAEHHFHRGELRDFGSYAIATSYGNNHCEVFGPSTIAGQRLPDTQHEWAALELNGLTPFSDYQALVEPGGVLFKIEKEMQTTAKLLGFWLEWP